MITSEDKSLWRQCDLEPIVWKQHAINQNDYDQCSVGSGNKIIFELRIFLYHYTCITMMIIYMSVCVSAFVYINTERQPRWPLCFYIYIAKFPTCSNKTNSWMKSRRYCHIIQLWCVATDSIWIHILLQPNVIFQDLEFEAMTMVGRMSHRKQHERFLQE